MKVIAAGALLWRFDKDELKVLVIHRTRYNDWSWPKGKVDDGEHIVTAAVREIKEETGLKVSLGPKLHISEYKLDNGNRKIVHYWSAEVTNQALRKQTFVPDEEVERFEWLSVKEAKKKLTYKHDVEPLNTLVSLIESTSANTKSLVVLRHAKATPRHEWSKGEASRPLLPEGAIQAVGLTKVLAAFGPRLVVTSSWKRCIDTVLPFVVKHKVNLLERSQLSEFGAVKGPQRTHKLISKLIEDKDNVVVCSHRPALPAIVDSLKTYSPKNLKSDLDQITGLKPGDFYVIHFAKNSKGNLKVVSLEHVEL